MLNYDLSPEIWGSYLQVCKILDVHPFWLLESILQCQGPHLQSRPPPPLVIAGQASPWRCLGDGGADCRPGPGLCCDCGRAGLGRNHIHRKLHRQHQQIWPASGAGGDALVGLCLSSSAVRSRDRGKFGVPTPQTQGFSAPFFGFEQDVNNPDVTWTYSCFSGGPFPINAYPITDQPTWAQATLLTPSCCHRPRPLACPWRRCSLWLQPQVEEAHQNQQGQ